MRMDLLLIIHHYLLEQRLLRLTTANNTKPEEAENYSENFMMCFGRGYHKQTLNEIIEVAKDKIETFSLTFSNEKGEKVTAGLKKE